MLTDEQKDGLGVAFNEARWLGAELDTQRRVAAVTLAVLTLPVDGPAPDDTRLQVRLSPVGRVVAVHRSAAGDLLPLAVGNLLATVEEFGGLAIYGWEFIDAAVPPLTMAEVSLDLTLGDEGHDHVLHLFQETGPVAGLDLWIWFRELECRTSRGERLSIEDVIAGGKRWWDGLAAGDPRTAGRGIFPGHDPRDSS